MGGGGGEEQFIYIYFFKVFRISLFFKREIHRNRKKNANFFVLMNLRTIFVEAPPPKPFSILPTIPGRLFRTCFASVREHLFNGWIHMGANIFYMKINVRLFARTLVRNRCTG